MVHGDGIKPSSGTQSKSFQTTGLDISDHIKHLSQFYTKINDFALLYVMF